MNPTELFTYLFLVLSGLVVGYWLFYRDRSHEEATRGKLKKENNDLQRSLQTSQVAFDSLEEKFGRQRGQLNVLQQLCDDWSSSREISERERAQLETDLSAKTSRMSEVEKEYRDEKRQRIALEDKVHKLSQEVLEKKAEVEEQWRGKCSEAESALHKRTVDLESIKVDRKQVSKQLHSANARIAELESEIKSSKSLIETATTNATGLKQEYVSLESGLKATNDQLKQAQAELAKTVSEKEAAIKATADAEKQLAVMDKETETLGEQNSTLRQKVETTQAALTSTQEQLARVTEQRDQAMELEKAAGVVSSGLQKRLDNQESTIHMLRQSQDDALENLKHELKVRTELEAKFDARAEAIRGDAEKMRAEYEAQIEALRSETGDSKVSYEAQLEKARNDAEAARESVEAARKEVETARKDVESARKEAEKVSVQQAAKYEPQLKELRSQLARQAAQYAEHSRDLRNQLAQQRSELEQERNRMTSESQSMASRFSTLETEATTYTQSIVKLDAKREQLQLELDAARKQMQAQLKQDSETIGELQRERNDLRTELEQVHLQIVPLQEQIDSHRAFTTELEMSQSRVVELERSLVQRDQESKRLHAQANELERLRQRYQDARERQEKLQLQLDEMVSRQITRESERSIDQARIHELEAQLKVSLETIEDLRKERALVLATLADQRQSQEPAATVISFTQSLEPQDVSSDDDYDQEYGGRMRRDANRGMVFTEAPASCDDLKRISGIAEVLEKRLNDFGIYTFKQVMDWKPEEIEEFSRLLAFRDRIERDDWQGQARFFYNQKRKSVRAVA
ncbi:hypothetical protein [Mariniblastus fucicola]|nr:hypothetical protein [Mariniblastus fucicola]